MSGASNSWVEVGEGVFARRYQPWDVTVGVVIGDAGLLVIDTRASAEEGDELRHDLRHLDPRPPRWIVNTHDHFDHLAGNVSLLPAAVWSHPSLEPAPDHAVEGAVTADLGDRAVVLRHLGRGHTAGDVVATVAGAGVTFAGDLVEESGPPAYGEDSFPLEWPATNARLLGLVRDGDRIVPGHGAPVGRAFVAAQQRALDLAARTIRHLWVGEVPVDEALAEGADRWPFPPEALRTAVRLGYRHLNVSAGRDSDG
ncbi:MAG: MBL fold metallo-hydrolase [Acidimicrobiales bacterium]